MSESPSKKQKILPIEESDYDDDMIPPDQRHTEESSFRLYTAVPIDTPISTTEQGNDNMDTTVPTQAPSKATAEDL